MYKDEEIEFRVFDYGYRYALRERSGGDVLVFLDLRVIQLYRHNGMPDTKTLLLDFGAQGSFEYKIPVFKLLEHSIEEISRRRMIILMPFMILKLRDSLKRERSPENMEALRKLILDDIIPSLTLVKVKSGYKSSNYADCSHFLFENDLCYFFTSIVLVLFIMLLMADFEINS